MHRRFAAILAVALCASVARAEDSRPRLLVLDLSVNSGVEEGVAKTLGEAITAELAKRGYFQVMSSRDVQTLVGVERQKQLMGCSEEAKSCFAELAGALGAQLTLSGSVGKLGDTYQLSLQTLDTNKSQPIARSTRLAKTLEGLRAAIPYAVAEATATPAPEPPSRTLSYALIGGGAAALVGGAVVGFQAVNADNALNRELSIAQKSGTATRPLADVNSDVQSIGQQRTISLAAMGVGAALVGAGILFLPKVEGDAGAVAMVPTTSGAMFVGVFR